MHIFFALLKLKANVMFTSISLTTLQLITSKQIYFLQDPKIPRRTTHLTKSTEQCLFWKSNRFSDNLQISNICWKAKIHYYTRIEKNMLCVTIVSHKHSVLNIPNYFFKMDFHTVLHLYLDLPSRLYYLGFTTESLYTFIFSAMPTTLICQALYGGKKPASFKKGQNISSYVMYFLRQKKP